MKLQKLMYYAHGFTLARVGRPLLPEPVQAWDHGPVAPEAYRMFSSYRNRPIELSARTDEVSASLPGHVQGVLEDVWSEYGHYSAWDLREMTHDESPWRNTYVEDEKEIPIPDDVMQAYFSTVLAAVGPNSASSRFASVLGNLRARRDEMGSRKDSGDMSEMAREHEEMAELRRQANAEILS